MPVTDQIVFTTVNYANFFCEISVNLHFFFFSSKRSLRLTVSPSADAHFHLDKSRSAMNNFTHKRCCREVDINFDDEQQTVPRRRRSRRCRRGSRQGAPSTRASRRNTLLAHEKAPKPPTHDMRTRTVHRNVEQRSFFSSVGSEYHITDLPQTNDAAGKKKTFVSCGGGVFDPIAEYA